jgi:hypothetical protein
MKPPDRIFLPWEAYEKYYDSTWCDTLYKDTDVEYIRMDLYDQLKAELDALKERVKTENE